MPTKQIASLVLDETIWPRHSISDPNVGALVEAIHAGANLPPVLIDRASGVVVDGFHRVRAYERVFGPEYEIEVRTKQYKDRRAMLADAIALNVGRGSDLNRWDLTRCIVLADEVGLPFNNLAALLQWQPERLAAYRDTRMGTTLDDRKVMLKRSLRRHLNKPLTKAQEEVNKHATGMSPLFLVNQIISFL